MTTLTYLWCFIAGLLGMLFHIFAVSMPAVKTRATVANMQFTYGCYFKDEAAAIIANLLTILILLVTLNELVAFKPEVIPWLKAAFVLVGYTGSSLLITVLGKASGKINTVVDIKSNEADGLPPPSDATTKL